MYVLFCMNTQQLMVRTYLYKVTTLEGGLNTSKFLTKLLKLSSVNFLSTRVTMRIKACITLYRVTMWIKAYIWILTAYDVVVWLRRVLLLFVQREILDIVSGGLLLAVRLRLAAVAGGGGGGLGRGGALRHAARFLAAPRRAHRPLAAVYAAISYLQQLNIADVSVAYGTFKHHVCQTLVCVRKNYVNSSVLIAEVKKIKNNWLATLTINYKCNSLDEQIDGCLLHLQRRTTERIKVKF